MTSYGQFCPVAKAAEVFAERWTPLVLRELLCGSHRFNDLHRGVPLISRSLLTQRLRQLEEAGIVERRPGARGGGAEYHLTPAGEEFRPVVMMLGEWGQRWTRRFESIDSAAMTTFAEALARGRAAHARVTLGQALVRPTGLGGSPSSTLS